jgi:hypothetical protein
MALCMIVENPDQTEEQADAIIAHLRGTGPVPPEGARLVLSGPADPGWRVISVWDSEDARDRFFAERLSAAYEAAGLSFGRIKRTQFELHGLVAGDLTSVRQPA